MPRNAYECISNSNLQSIMEEMKRKYQYILFDCLPITVGSEVFLISEGCDELMLVISNEHAYKRVLKQMNIRLQNLGIPLQGVILNDMTNEFLPMDKKYYGYNDYYANYDFEEQEENSELQI